VNAEHLLRRHALLLIALCTAGLVTGPTVAGAAAPAKWTIMAYLDGDNDLEGAGIQDINEMELAPNSSEVNILVQFDRIPGSNSSNGNWTDTRRYRIMHDTNMAIIRSVQVGPTLGELNMGDPSTLVDFAHWCIDNYPADHYALILWDHGTGWKKSADIRPYKSIAWDETSEDYLSTAEMASALGSISALLGGKLDIVACDACLMQMAEVAYQIRSSADYYVASEEVIPWSGFPYDAWLTPLTANPDMPALDLSHLMVDTYVASYKAGSQGTDWVTLSVVDLSQIAGLAAAVDDLGTALTNAMPSYCEYILSYWSAAQCYSDPDYRDVGHLAQLMQDNVSDDAVRSAAEAVISAVDATVIANGSVGLPLADSHGISFYYPPPNEYDPAYTALAFAADTFWDEHVSGDIPCNGVLPDAYEADDTCSQASVAGVGASQKDHWFHLGGDEDWAGFDAQEGVPYVIRTQSLGYCCDTLIYLYDTDGASLIVWDDDSGPEYLSSQIEWTCPTTGTYYVEVVHYDGEAFGLNTHYDLYLAEVTFSDVSADYWAFSYIAACVNAGIVAGFDDATYRPTIAVTREQIAVYISRALAHGDANVPTGPAQAAFPDVPTDHWAFKYVEYAVANDVVQGFPEGDYRPALAVDRGQMAAFIARSIVTPHGDSGLTDYTPPEMPTFPDVGTGSWAYKYVEYIAARGITSGYDDGTYRPTVTCTRDQIAVYVSRAFELLM